MAKQLLNKVEYSPVHPVRLLGLAVSNPPENHQLSVRPQWIQGTLDFGDGWDAELPSLSDDKKKKLLGNIGN
jgi:hypothetical protein